MATTQSDSKEKSKKSNIFDDYVVYNKKTKRQIFDPIYVAHNRDDLKSVIAYLKVVIEYLEKKIIYHKESDFFYWDFHKFRLRSFSLTLMKNWSKKNIVASFEQELMDVVKNLDFISTKYDAYHIAYPQIIATPKESTATKDDSAKSKKDKDEEKSRANSL